MPQRRAKDESKIEASRKPHPVVNKCLAIVLVIESHKKTARNIFDSESAADSTRSSQISKAPTQGYSGKDLFKDFKLQNQTCYWNQSLMESVRGLEYKGFVEPSTILVTGVDVHLENLRAAWGKRVLKAPDGFVIERIGDVSGIQIQVAPQTQFVPLPEALCSIIMQLNLRQVVATLERIWEKLMVWYRDVSLPPQQMVIDTLGSLIKDRKVFHTGSGYCVVTPDNSRLHGSISTSHASSSSPCWLPYHVPLYQEEMRKQIPVLPSRAHMRSISCQVTTIEETSEEEENVLESKKEKNKNVSTDALTKSSGQDSKVINCDAQPQVVVAPGKGDNKADTQSGVFKKPCPPKIKGQKTSIFSKLFNRRKRDKDRDKTVVPPSPALKVTATPSTATSGCTTSSQAKGDKEYATFSAQFPPPEWVWYQQQLAKHKQAGTLASHKPHRVHNPAQTTKGNKKSKPGIKFHASSNYLNHGSRNSLVPEGFCNNDYMPMATADIREQDYTNIKPESDDEFTRSQTERHNNTYESCNFSQRRFQKPRDLDKNQHQSSEYNEIDNNDVTPHNISMACHSVSAISPVSRAADESTYTKQLEQAKTGPFHSTPLCQARFDHFAHETMRYGQQSRFRKPPSSTHRQNKPQRHRVRAYNDFSGIGDDISYEYRGRLPKKTSSHARSTDSGVNCIGLGMVSEQNKRPPRPLYENVTSASVRHSYQCYNSNQHHHHRSRKLNTAQTYECVSPSDVNTTDTESQDMNSLCNTGCSRNSLSSQIDIANAAYDSVVYGSISDVPSLMAPHPTYTSTTSESLDMQLPHNSLQSDFYEESRTGFVQSNFVTPTNTSLAVQPQVAESLSSPGTIVVDVVGSPSTPERVGFNAAEEDIEKGSTDVHCKEFLATRKLMVKQQNLEATADACSRRDLNECCSTDKRLSKAEGGNIDCVDNRASSPGPSQAVIAEITRRQIMINGKRNCVLDSGFISPRNPGIASGGMEGRGSNLSNSASDNGCENSSCPHYGTPNNDDSGSSNKTPRSSADGSSGHHSSSDVYLASGSDL